MAGYVKIWTDIENDSWFISLNGNERGLWLQMIVYCKNHGDSGEIFLRNISHCATTFGFDRATMGRMLRKFAENERIELQLDSKPVRIKLLKYKYWQELSLKEFKQMESKK